jgi:hypothetical protein
MAIRRADQHAQGGDGDGVPVVSTWHCGIPELVEDGIRAGSRQSATRSPSPPLSASCWPRGRAGCQSRAPPGHPRLRLVRLAASGGNAVARKAGARAAWGRLIAFLDDDDELLPRFASTSLATLTSSRLPQPVAVLSGMEVLDPCGAVVQVRRPPTLPRGLSLLSRGTAAGHLLSV